MDEIANPLPWEKTVTYLGVVLDGRLTWAPHIQEMLSRVRARKIPLSPLIARHSHLSRENKLLIYKTMLRTVFTSACPVWCSVADSVLQALEKFNNTTILTICKAYRFMTYKRVRLEAGIESVREFVNKEVNKYFNSIRQKSNPLMRNVNLDALKKHYLVNNT